MIGGQSLGRKGNDLVFVNINGRGDKRSPIGKVLQNALTQLFHRLANLGDKNEPCDQAE